LKRPWAEDRFFTLCAFLVALLPRLYVALVYAREPVWDGHYYHFGALRIAQGLGYSEDVDIGGVLTWKPWCHYPVGYSAFLGGLYRLLGSRLWVAPVANALVGAITVALVHRLARRWLGPGRARMAAVLTALHPGLILYTGVVMTEGLTALSLVLVGFCAVSFRTPTWAGIGSGVALGLGALVRPTTLLAGPLLMAVFRGGRRRVLGTTVIAALACVGTIIPWTLRNCVVMDGCALISTNGGWNLAIGALTETGRFRTLTAKDGCPIVTGQVQQDRCWAELGRAVIARDPGRWLSLVPDKLAHTYNHESFAVGYLSEANPDLFPGERREQVRAANTLFHHALMLAASLAGIALVIPSRKAWRGLVTEPGRAFSHLDARSLVQPALLLLLALFVAYALDHPEHPLYWAIVVSPLLIWLPLPERPPQNGVALYLSGLVLATSLTHAVFFGEDRYHVTITPVLCVLAAAALRRPARPPGEEPNPRAS
jgi:4-amino-4-deoxy-L-arabinose transferase-like glycosyltransferase